MTCVHINNCFDKIVKLTDEGIAQLESTSAVRPTPCLEYHLQIQKSNLPLENTEAADNFLTQLSSEKLPLNNRVQDWLNHSDGDPTKPVYCNFIPTPLKNVLQQRVSECPPTSASKIDVSTSNGTTIKKGCVEEAAHPISDVSKTLCCTMYMYILINELNYVRVFTHNKN